MMESLGQTGVSNICLKLHGNFPAARTHTRQVCKIEKPTGRATPYGWSIVAKGLLPSVLFVEGPGL